MNGMESASYAMEDFVHTDLKNNQASVVNLNDSVLHS
jgi:hypothetical protein